MPPDAGDSVGTGPRRVGTKTLSHEICRAFCFAFSCTGVVLDPHPAAALLRMLQPAYQPAHGMRMSHTDATTNSRTPPLLLCYALRVHVNHADLRLVPRCVVENAAD